MSILKSISSCSRCFPYLASTVFFVLLTFPEGKNFNLHKEAGYFFYIIISILIILFIHFGIIKIISSVVHTKFTECEVYFEILKERFNFVLGVLIVILFEGLCGNCFSYRDWSYGVGKAENVIEKLDSEWNFKQIERSKEVSSKFSKPVNDYTEALVRKWKVLKSNI